MVHRLRICRSRRMRVVGVNGWMGSDWNRTHLMSAIVANAAGERENGACAGRLKPAPGNLSVSLPEPIGWGR